MSTYDPSGSPLAAWAVTGPSSDVTAITGLALQAREVLVTGLLANGQTVLVRYTTEGVAADRTVIRAGGAAPFAAAPDGALYTTKDLGPVVRVGSNRDIGRLSHGAPVAGEFSFDGPTDLAFSPSTDNIVVADQSAGRISTFTPRGELREACPFLPNGVAPFPSAGTVAANSTGRIAVGGVTTVSFVREVSHTAHPCDRGPAGVLRSFLSPAATVVTRAAAGRVVWRARLSKAARLAVCLQRAGTARCIATTTIAQGAQGVSSPIGRRFELDHRPRGRYLIVAHAAGIPHAAQNIIRFEIE